MFSFLLFSLGLADTHIYILVNALDLRKHFATTLVIVGNSNFLHPKASDSKTISVSTLMLSNLTISINIKDFSFLFSALAHILGTLLV